MVVYPMWFTYLIFNFSIQSIGKGNLLPDSEELPAEYFSKINDYISQRRIRKKQNNFEFITRITYTTTFLLPANSVQSVQTVVRLLVDRIHSGWRQLLDMSGRRPVAVVPVDRFVVANVVVVVVIVVGRVVACRFRSVADAVATATAVILRTGFGRAARRTPAGRQHHVQQIGPFLRIAETRRRTR